MYSKKNLAERMGKSENPFLESLTIPVTKAKHWIRKEKDENGKSVAAPVYFERTPFTSLFLDEKCEDKVRGLSAGAKSLLLHVLFRIDRNRDYIVLEADDYLTAEKKKSVVAFKNARMELCDHGFLAKASPRGVYWINPARFFRGNRPNKFPENRDVQYEIK